jgi:hypothetical protein
MMAAILTQNKVDQQGPQFGRGPQFGGDAGKFARNFPAAPLVQLLGAHVERVARFPRAEYVEGPARSTKYETDRGRSLREKPRLTRCLVNPVLSR